MMNTIPVVFRTVLYSHFIITIEIERKMMGSNALLLPFVPVVIRILL
ncbi:hypothetical protein [Maribacter sp. 2-571]